MIPDKILVVVVGSRPWQGRGRDYEVRKDQCLLTAIVWEKVEGVRTVKPLFFPSLHGFERMRKMKNWAVPERLPVVVTGAASAGSDGIFSVQLYAHNPEEKGSRRCPH